MTFAKTVHILLGILFASTVSAQGGAPTPTPPLNAGGIAAPTQWQPTNSPDSGTATATGGASSTVEMPWDVVQATAAGEGYEYGDLLFPLSDSGKENLGGLFSGIQSTCGLNRKHKHHVKSLHRRDLNGMHCALSSLETSPLAGLDTGVSLGLSTLETPDGAIDLSTVPTGAVVAFFAWLIGNGAVPDQQSVRIPLANVKYVSPDKIRTGNDEAGEAIIVDPWPNSNLIESKALIAWTRVVLENKMGQMTYAFRKRTRQWAVGPDHCQRAQMSVARRVVDEMIENWCSSFDGTILGGSNPRADTQYPRDGYLIWVSAVPWTDTPNQYCGAAPSIDQQECKEALTTAANFCDPDKEYSSGAAGFGECVKFTLTLDPDMDRETLPEWDQISYGPNPPRPQPPQDVLDLAPTSYKCTNIGSGNNLLTSLTDFIGGGSRTDSFGCTGSNAVNMGMLNPWAEFSGGYYTTKYIPKKGAPPDCLIFNSPTYDDRARKLCIYAKWNIVDSCPEHGGTIDTVCGEWVMRICPDAFSCIADFD